MLNNIANIRPLYDLASAIIHWASYIKKVSHCDILEESSLKYPITEYLERYKGAECALEWPHAVFKQRRIDIVWNNKTDGEINLEINRDKDKKWDNFLELKYATTKDAQLLFNDLCRLYYLKKKFPESRCYFLYCGENDIYTQNFKTKIIKENIYEERDGIRILKKEKEYPKSTSGKLTKWFTLQMQTPNKTIEIAAGNTQYRKFLSKEKGRFVFYDNNDKIDAPTFITRLIERQEDSNSNQELSVAIWEILLPENNN